MQFVCIFFHICLISAENLNFSFSKLVQQHTQGEMDIVVWVLQQISYASQQCKNFENLLIFDKVTEFKGGNFFETWCSVIACGYHCTTSLTFHYQRHLFFFFFTVILKPSYSQNLSFHSHLSLAQACLLEFDHPVFGSHWRRQCW